MKKYLMLYLSSYLIGGGLGFAVLPELTQKLMLSDVIYDEPMVRLAGLLMVMLGSLIGYLVVILKDFSAYKFSIIARTVLVFFVLWMWFEFKNPMFIVLEVIVLVGLIPSYFILLKQE